MTLKLASNTPSDPPPLPPLRTFIVRRAGLPEVMVAAHTSESSDGVLSFMVYTLVGNQPCGWVNRVFKVWDEMEEVPANSVLVH